MWGCRRAESQLRGRQRSAAAYDGVVIDHHDPLGVPRHLRVDRVAHRRQEAVLRVERARDVRAVVGRAARRAEVARRPARGVGERLGRVAAALRAGAVVDAPHLQVLRRRHELDGAQPRPRWRRRRRCCRRPSAPGGGEDCAACTTPLRRVRLAVDVRPDAAAPRHTGGQPPLPPRRAAWPGRSDATQVPFFCLSEPRGQRAGRYRHDDKLPHRHRPRLAVATAAGLRGARLAQLSGGGHARRQQAAADPLLRQGRRVLLVLLVRLARLAGRLDQ